MRRARPGAHREPHMAAGRHPSTEAHALGVTQDERHGSRHAGSWSSAGCRQPRSSCLSCARLPRLCRRHRVAGHRSLRRRRCAAVELKLETRSRCCEGSQLPVSGLAARPISIDRISTPRPSPKRKAAARRGRDSELQAGGGSALWSRYADGAREPRAAVKYRENLRLLRTLVFGWYAICSQRDWRAPDRRWPAGHGTRCLYLTVEEIELAAGMADPGRISLAARLARPNMRRFKS